MKKVDIDRKFEVTLDHIGIAVSDIEKSINLYAGMGLGLAAREVITDQGVEVAVFPAGESRIELLSPLAEDSPVGRFIESKGAGIHHIAFKVEDIITAIKVCKAKGMRMIDDEPRAGAGGNLIAFIHPCSSDGVLIELIQEMGENNMVC